MLIPKKLEAGEECIAEDIINSPGSFNLTVPNPLDDTFAELIIPAGSLEMEGVFYMCLKVDSSTLELVHQGTRKSVAIKVGAKFHFHIRYAAFEMSFSFFKRTRNKIEY